MAVLLLSANVFAEKETYQIVSFQRKDMQGDSLVVVQDWVKDSGIIKMDGSNLTMLKNDKIIKFVQIGQPTIGNGKVDDKVSYVSQTTAYYEVESECKVTVNVFAYTDDTVMIMFEWPGSYLKYMVLVL